MRIDHKNGTLRFGAEQLEGDHIRDHIAAMAKRLTQALTMINPAANPGREKRRLLVRAPRPRVVLSDRGAGQASSKAERGAGQRCRWPGTAQPCPPSTQAQAQAPEAVWRPG